MTLMFAPIAGLLAGTLLGRSRAAYAVTALVWYVGLAAQTVYLVKPGTTDFFSKSGTSTVRHLPYWVVQPPILGIAALLVVVGANLGSRLRSRRQTRNAPNLSTG
jgi:DMSO/TMAO reductase YedYZ heme-binding membrane subunit